MPEYICTSEGVRNKSRGEGIYKVKATGTDSNKFRNGVEAMEEADWANAEPFDGVAGVFVMLSCTRSLASSRVSSSSWSSSYCPFKEPIAAHVRANTAVTSPSFTTMFPSPSRLSYAILSALRHLDRILSSASVIKAMANSPRPSRKNSLRSDKISMTLLRGKSFSNVVCDNDDRIEVMTLEKFALSIGNFRVESCWRCDDSKSNSGELELDTPLTRMWFSERPMKSRELAVDTDTNAGSNSGMLWYSLCIISNMFPHLTKTTYLNVTPNNLHKKVLSPKTR